MEIPILNRQVASSECLAEELEKPLLDNRTYRVIRLPNQLEALVIHDPDTDKASAALDVNAGAFSDAKDMPGMAHAVEHFLFMGTEKYPKENEYSRYLAAHSGHSNAFTASTSTNYYFEIASRAENSATSDTGGKESNPLYGALDRFAQFFIAPLFLEDTLDRELKAVDSENKKNLQSDAWRLSQLGKSLANPKHPYNHFSTGNLKTLRDDPIGRGVRIRERFMEFHAQQYSANRMKLVVLGREPLDHLQTWVEELFADVQNKNLPQNRWDGILPYTEHELLTETRATPVMDSRSLSISFPFMDEEHLYDFQPGRYLSHLIGHEGPGSILAYIKAKGWANGLSAGEYDLCPGSALFNIDVKLTPEGLEHYREVAKVIFQYISILREGDPQEWIFDEIKGMTEVDFRFKQKSPASRTTSQLAQTMQRPLPRGRLLSGSSVIRKFDSSLISKALSYLNADSFRFTIISQDAVQGDVQHEEWYGTDYNIRKIPQDFLSELRNAINSTPAERLQELSLPARNEFIPSKLEVEKKTVSEPSKMPNLIRREDNIRIWFKKDDQFWVPKANVNVLLRSPMCGLTPRSLVTASIFAELVEDSLAEYSYDAEIAGLAYRFYASASGLTVHVHGYNDKLPVLLEKVLVSVRDLEIKEDRFKIIKERLTRGYRNSEFVAPYQQIGQYTRWLGSERGWVTEQYLNELAGIQANDVRAFKPLLLGQMHIETLVDGNVYQEDALHIGDLIEKTLKPQPLPSSQWPVKRGLVVPQGSNYMYPRPLKDPSNVNHCISYVLYVGDKKDLDRCAQLLLFAQMTHEPAFNQLRTQEQLGYVVFSGPVTHVTNVGYYVLIQSERSPDYLESRIENFLFRFKQDLADMSETDFEAHRNSVINERLEKLKNLNQESDRFWHHISSEFYHFDQVDDDVEHLRALTKEDMVTFFDNYIDPSSSLRAKISVHLEAQKSASIAPGDAAQEKEAKSNSSSQATIIEDVHAFKSSLALSAGARPVKDLSVYEDLVPKL